MKVAVIGGGWAGSSAAWTLYRLGCQVHIFESSHVLGGRARSQYSKRLNITADNGQHILLGAYDHTLRLMQEMGLDTDSLFLRLPLRLCTLNEDIDFRLGRLPAPLHLAVGLLRSRGFSWSDKWGLAKVARALHDTARPPQPGCTVSQWLERLGQSPRIQAQFWRPLCIAALNTPPGQASAELFMAVLRDSLGSDARACDILLPKVGLTQLWPEHLPSAIRRHLGHTVRQLKTEPHAVYVDDHGFDAAILATNVPSALRILQSQPPRTPVRPGAEAEVESYIRALQAFDYAPIATLTLRLERPWRRQAPIRMLHENVSMGHYGQWLFNRATFGLVPEDQHLVHIVVSDAGPLLRLPRETAVNALLEQLRAEVGAPDDLPAVLAHELIIEKRATFLATPGLPRPDNATPWPRLWTAGDWTDTGYPAVLEGAVRSGVRAAKAVHESLALNGSH